MMPVYSEIDVQVVMILRLCGCSFGYFGENFSKNNKKMLYLQTVYHIV